MQIDAVLFDIGGVLELTPPTGWQERWQAILGIDRAQLEARLEPYFRTGATGEITLAEVEQGIASALALDRAGLTTFMDDLWAEYLGTLNVELADCFTGLRPRYRTGILSNSFVGAREREHERYGFERMCDELVYSHEVGLLKPDARFYRLAAERLGVRVERCVFLDDTSECVEGARAVGMHAIEFTDTRRAICDLKRVLGTRARFGAVCLETRPPR